jgi:DNA-binding MarR family transcriptional regulator
MTNRLDRLEARGLIDRRPDPEDGRARRIRLTDRGRDHADAAVADLLDRERRLLGGLSEQDRGTLAALLRTVLVNFEDRAIDG